MKFKIDENLPIEVAQILGQTGYDASTVYSQNLVGEPDRVIASKCQNEARAIITLDTDFADIRAYPPQEYAGFIVLRLRQQGKPYVIQIIERVMRALMHKNKGLEKICATQ
jgi:predicted nuclease of predicted toxin-antitoxin system